MADHVRGPTRASAEYRNGPTLNVVLGDFADERFGPAAIRIKVYARGVGNPKVGQASHKRKNLPATIGGEGLAALREVTVMERAQPAGDCCSSAVMSSGQPGHSPTKAD